MASFPASRSREGDRLYSCVSSRHSEGCNAFDGDHACLEELACP
jgi:hypothetical protein